MPYPIARKRWLPPSLTGKVQLKHFIIGGIALLLVFAGYKMFFGKVDRTQPDAVAKAFVAAVKGNDIDTAGEFWLPDASVAWQSDAKQKLEKMSSGAFTRFLEGLPGSSAQYVSSRKPKQPDNEQTLSTEGLTLDLRQIEGKWWVFRGPI